MISNEKKVSKNSWEKKVVFEFNQTRSDYDRTKLIHELFQDIASKEPKNIALSYEGIDISYGDLNKWSNKIAHFLHKRNNGSNPEPIVAIMMERSPEMIASIFGVLKSGGAYLPIDIKWPKDRIREILQDSKAGTLVTSSNFVRSSTDILWDVDSLNSVVCVDEIKDDVGRSFQSDTDKIEKIWDFVSESSNDSTSAGGWINSYTGKAFSGLEIDEIVENVYSKVRPYLNASTRVLEVGCGSGLILEKIAPGVGLYVGTDIAGGAVDKLKSKIKGFINTKLYALPADKLNELIEKDFDVIIINSVSQFFPGIYYFDQVLEKCSSLLKDKGIILISDIRDKSLAEAYYESLGRSKKVKNLNEFVRMKKDMNTELFMPRNYFTNVKWSHEFIDDASISLKKGNIDNELTKYRYDALIKIDKKQERKFPTFAPKMIFKKEEIEMQSDSNLEFIKLSPNNLVYIIYTSGSTGKPKGVMIEHGSLLNRLFWMQNRYPLSKSDSLLLKTPYTFDVSVWEIFWWSMAGAKLSILKQDEERNPAALCEAISRNSVSVIHFVPSMFSIFLEYLGSESKLIDKVKSLKRIFTSGEELKASQVRLFRKIFEPRKDINLSNLYGPTEATVDVSYFDCLADIDSIPIGRPIDNTQLYILNKKMGAVNIGEVGELYISGDGLARGYLNNPELTKSRFVRNPFISGKLMYKTGDLAKFLPDGNILYLGRTDFQVKIRGIRIELGEIENVILSYPGINSAVALAVGDFSQELLAYYSSLKKLNEEDIKKYLSDRLPVYMIPDRLVFLKELPINRHGKIDRKALPEPSVFVESINAGSNLNVATALKNIWIEILRRKDVNLNSNFFEMGGHSIKVVEAVHKINNQFRIDFGIGSFFTIPVLKDQIDYIEKKKRETEQYLVIPPAEKGKYYRLSHAQKRLWFLYEMDKKSCAYNVLQTTVIKGDLDIKKLEVAINMVIDKHEILRTNFIFKNGEPVQVIHRKRPIKIVRSKADDSKEVIDAKIKKSWLKPFILQTDKLIRVEAIKINKSKHIVVIVLHHITCDGWSLDVINDEILHLYEALVNKTDMPTVPDLELQVRDYSEWENGGDFISFINKQRGYWLKQFSGYDFEELSLPEDEYIKDSSKGISNVVFKKISPEIHKKINEICSKTGVTSYIVFISAFYAYLSRISDQKTIVIGMPITARLNQQVKNSVGLFANTIAAPLTLDPEEKFTDILLRVRDMQIDIQNNQYYPFDLLVKEIGKSGSLGSNPLFRVACTEYDLSRDRLILANTHSASYKMPVCPTMFDLVFSVVRNGGKTFEIAVAGSSMLFSKQTIERLTENFTTYLGGILSNIEKDIYEPSVISPGEEKLLASFNHAFEQKLEEGLCLQDLLIRSAKKYPKNIAIRIGDREITYEDFDAQTSLLSNYFKSIGIGKGTMVPILFQRGIDVFITIYALFKAGAAYIPIDPEYPSDRIIGIVEDSQAKFVIMGGELAKKILVFSERVNCLIFSDVFAASQTTVYTSQPGISKPSDLAYVIYTSGSTGKPKGVMCTHTGVINSTLFGLSYFNLSPESKILQVGNITFDTSVWEMNMSIGCGGALILIPQDTLRDPEKIIELIKKESVTFGLFIPTMLANLDMRNTPLKRLVSGGEEISPLLAKKMMDFGNYYNAYGPTEASICATVWKSNDKIGKTVPIGKPLPNTQIHILGRFNKQMPIGCTGEIYISGRGLARGYLNDKEKTEKVFVTDRLKNMILYKTGDLGKWLPDGNLVYKGRVDNQVKIRGYRIELSEIEASILDMGGVSQTVVRVKTLKDADRLVAYCVIDKGFQIKENTIRTFLQTKLPAYMVPESFFFINSIPQKVNGKVDYEALLKIQDVQNLTDANSSSNHATNKDEENIIDAWKQAGGITKIQVDDDFFKIGGHSILVLKVLFYLKLKYKYDITAQDFYSYPTARLLANFVLGKKKVRKIYDDGLDRKINNSVFSQQEEYRLNSVFVTGGSGYLGAFLIKELLKTECDKIYALVRADTQDQAEEKVFSNLDFYFTNYDKRRIVPVIGDIEKDSCGLSGSIKDVILNRVNLIVHAAANTSHIGFEEQFYRTNTSGTKNILDFAYRNKTIRVCVISTLSVSGERTRGVLAEYGEDDFDVGQKFSNIYEKTKFESEKIARAAIKEGLNVLVVRLGNLVGGPIQKNPRDNSFYQYLAAIIGTKRDWNIDASIDISPVDISAGGVISLCKMRRLPIHTFHLFNSHTIPTSEVIKFVKQLGWKISTGNGTISKDNDRHVAYLTNYLSSQSGYGGFIYKDTETRKVMKESIHWPIVGKKVIKDILDKMKKYNLI